MPTPSPQPPLRAMALIEIMVVIVLIGLISAAIGVSVVAAKDEADVDIARGQVSTLVRSCDHYRLRYGVYPSTSDGNTILSHGVVASASTFFADVPDDPWGRPYRYAFPALRSGRSVDVWSVGRDGIDGSDDDVGNWRSSPR